MHRQDFVIIVSVQATWLAEATAARFAAPECVETRTWEDIAAEGLVAPAFMTGGLGSEFWPDFWAWACWQQHLCMTAEQRKNGESMCYVYDENGSRWLPWGLYSEVFQCSAA